MKKTRILSTALLKKLILLSLITLLITACSHEVVIKTKEDAVKFLESHTWNGKNVTYRTRGEESTNAAWNGDITFSNNKVIYDQEWSYYTIAMDQEGDNNWFFIVTFNNSKMSPITRGTEIFKLFKNGTAKCYPLGTDDGIFADYDFPEERTPDSVIQNKPAQPQAITLTLIDGKECLNYLQGKTFSTSLAKIIITKDFHVKIYTLPSNSIIFDGTMFLGNAESNDRIIELHSASNVQRYYLYSDGHLEDGSGEGMRYRPEQIIQNNSTEHTDAVTEHQDALNDSILRVQKTKIKPDGFDSTK